VILCQFFFKLFPVFFFGSFFPLLWCRHVGNHPQEDLARLLLKALGLANPVQIRSFFSNFFPTKIQKKHYASHDFGFGGGKCHDLFLFP